MGDRYILSAVRTPIGVLNGALSSFTAAQLGFFAIAEALQRAAIPSQELQKVFLGCALHKNWSEELIKRAGLSKTVIVSSTSESGMKSFIEAVRFLGTTKGNVCLTGGMDSISNLSSTKIQQFLNSIKKKQKHSENFLKNHLSSDDMNNYLEQDFRNFMEATKNGAFLDEIIKINFKKKGHQIILTEDEMFQKQNLYKSVQGKSNLEYLPTFGDGAVAIAISTEEYFSNNKLTPLAKIISFANETSNMNDLSSAYLHAVEKVLKVAGCQCNEITKWEIDSVTNEVIFNCVNHFNINFSTINKHGSVFSFGYPFGMSGARAICHLTHSLSAGELGCALCDFNGAVSAVIIKKLRGKSSEKPELTLYTRKLCPLCDEMKEQLSNFKGEFFLQEVDIDAEENKRYNGLFKYEIPVLFLNGRFFCKHRLDAQHFSRRLSELQIEKNRPK